MVYETLSYTLATLFFMILFNYTNVIMTLFLHKIKTHIIIYLYVTISLFLRFKMTKTHLCHEYI
jgi:hypothetical protein